jgi:hypothetical protein
LWERWQNPTSSGLLETFTIVTTAANELMRPIHGRMPLIPSSAYSDEWLASGEPPVELLTTPEAPDFEALPFSSWVNSPEHDDARCMAPCDRKEIVSAVRKGSFHGSAERAASHEGHCRGGMPALTCRGLGTARGTRAEISRRTRFAVDRGSAEELCFGFD